MFPVYLKILILATIIGEIFFAYVCVAKYISYKVRAEAYLK